MAPRQPRRMVDPDYAGQIRAGIGAKLNGQMTSSNSFKAFQTPMGGGFTKEQGKQFERNRRDLMFPNAGPSSVARNVDKAGRAFYDFSGIGTNPQGNFSVDPLMLAATLFPVGKIAGGIGRVVKSLIPFERRVGAAAGRLTPLAQRALPGAERLAAETTKRAEAAGALLRESRSDAYKAITDLEKYSGMDYASSWYGDLGTHAERLAAGRRPVADAASAAASRAAARLGQTRRIAADASEQLKSRFERYKSVK